MLLPFLCPSCDSSLLQPFRLPRFHCPPFPPCPATKRCESLLASTGMARAPTGWLRWLARPSSTTAAPCPASSCTQGRPAQCSPSTSSPLPTCAHCLCECTACFVGWSPVHIGVPVECKLRLFESSSVVVTLANVLIQWLPQVPPCVRHPRAAGAWQAHGELPALLASKGPPHLPHSPSHLPIMRFEMLQQAVM